MTSFARVAVTCPRCDETFFESARLIRAGGSAWCPACQSLFDLDRALPGIRQAVREARMARSRRHDRIAELRRHWAEPAPLERTPHLKSDLLRTLDALIARMSEESGEG
jgi:hypothetical protein